MPTATVRILSGALAAFAVVASLRLAGSLERMELSAHDAGLRARAVSVIDPRIVIIDETEDDLRRFGHPLSDELLATLIERAHALGPRIIGIDKFRDIPVPPGSETLDRVLAMHPDVYWGYQFGGHGMRRISPPRLLAGTARSGFVDVLIDPGGAVRRGLLYLDEDGPPQASFALSLALGYLARDGITARSDTARAANLRLGKSTVAPLEANDGGYAGADAAGYQILLDYQAAPARFDRVTLGELLDGKAAPALFRDRIAIFGSSAESLKDYFQTPFSRGGTQYMSGTEVHAHLTSQLLRLAAGESRPVRTLPDALEYALLALCCAFGLGAWLAGRALTLGAFVVAGAAALAGTWLVLAQSTLWFPVVPLALGFLLSSSFSGGLRAVHEARERANLMALFSRHVAPEVAREIWAHRAELLDGHALRPRHLQATVLFADLHGFSAIAERLSPGETGRWLNQFMAPMADIIMRHGGVIRQYAGDAIMAVFGAPKPRTTPEEIERDARAAVACAAEMCREFQRLNETWRQAALPTAGLRIGIQSGPMVSCSIGSRDRQEFTVVGDVVNVAARLQSIALPEGDEGEGGRLLIGDETRRLLPIHERCERLGSYPVKGRREPVTIYRMPT